MTPGNQILPGEVSFCPQPCTGSLIEVPQGISLARVLALVFCHLSHIPDTDSIEKKGLLLVHGLSSVGPGLASSNAAACSGHANMLASYQKTCGGANQPRTAVTGSRNRILL